MGRVCATRTRTLSDGGRVARAEGASFNHDLAAAERCGWELKGDTDGASFVERSAVDEVHAVPLGQSNASAADLLLAVLTEEVFEEVRSAAFQESEVAQASYADFIGYVAFRILLLARGLVFKEDGKQVLLINMIHITRMWAVEQLGIDRNAVRGVFPYGMSFMKMHSKLPIPSHVAAGAISTNMRAFVELKDYVSLDEKLRKYYGYSVFARSIPAKPEKRGHWVTELAPCLSTSLETTVPYLVGTIPL